ncbi:hypothetical protein [Cohnella sp. AR92]|uniref:hypothetical protein n=1 Tax=Cohnella sp. AR92 TaxID=648716 RepID=UPI000F8EA9E1|nr:hypothetical protein [Cohnella sp. AR92]RUS46022.1 hypothetical protein ELR57_16380 [Cohnella sp. AR92]
MQVRELEHFPLLSDNLVEILSYPSAYPPHATQADREFWEEDRDNRDPFYENTVLLHYPTVRNRMGYDLSNGNGDAFAAEDVSAQLQKEGLFRYPADFYRQYHYHYFEAIARLWAWRFTSEKPTKAKLNKCNAFASALYDGITGFVDGDFPDFLGKAHKEAYFALLLQLEKEGAASPYRSLQILYSLLEFCGLTRIVD